MNILLLTQLFQPEPNHLKGLAFAQELARRGHNVEVLTGFPNYPGGKLYPGYHQELFKREILDNIHIIRVPLYMDHSSSGLRRILCYLSLAFSMCLPGLLLVKKPDIVHVYQGPGTLAIPAMILRMFKRVPFILDIQDLWPDSVLSSGMLKIPYASKLLHWWCDLTYRMASRIVVLSPGYKNALINRGVPATKIEVVYNWCNEDQLLNQRSGYNLEMQTSKKKFTVVYAGNFGTVQALEIVVRAAKILQSLHHDVQFVLVGDGVESDKLSEIIVAECISNVEIVPRLPLDKVGSILSQADALLVHLRDDPLCRIGIPQKTQAYLAMGRPIIMAVRGDAAALITNAGAGVVCEPENSESIAQAVLLLKNTSLEEREIMARNARTYYEKYLSFNVGINQMESVFSGAVQ
jgi:glycosyltransferase involved in cell wall biosynthesis